MCIRDRDEIELKRVFDNLMTNTIRYREKDSSLVEIKIGQTEDKKQAWLEFSDDGPGVPEDSLERIFESFYRVDASRTRDVYKRQVPTWPIISCPRCWRL